MSVRTSAAGPALQVKKTRTSNAPKKEAAPKAPRAKKGTTTAAMKTSSKTNSPARPLSNGPVANKDGDDLDNIVTGIKKITLVTNKQKQARAREAKKTSGTSTPTTEGPANAQSAPATPMDEGVSLSSTSNGNKPSEDFRLKKEAVAEIKLETVDTPMANIPDAAANIEVQTPTAAAHQAPTEQVSATDNFIHYQPTGPIPETIPTTQQPLNWLPVNTGSTPVPSPAKPETINNNHEDDDSVMVLTTPIPNEKQQEHPSMMPPPPQTDYSLMSPSPMKRGDLPIFTPTSQLRFSTPQQQGGQRKVDNTMWEVPETPQS